MNSTRIREPSPHRSLVRTRTGSYFPFKSVRSKQLSRLQEAKHGLWRSALSLALVFHSYSAVTRKSQHGHNDQARLIAAQRITGNSTLLLSPSLSIRSPCVHAKGSVRSSGESDTLKRSSSYSNIAMHRANAMHEVVCVRYAPVSGFYKSTINRSTISRETNNDPNLRRASSCFNVNIAIPRLNWTRPTVRQRVRPPPALPPYTTTSLDFTCHPIRRTPRSVVRCVGTPRGNTPHPAFQSPYTRHKKVSVCAG